MSEEVRRIQQAIARRLEGKPPASLSFASIQRVLAYKSAIEKARKAATGKLSLARLRSAHSDLEFFYNEEVKQ